MEGVTEVARLASEAADCRQQLLHEIRIEHGLIVVDDDAPVIPILPTPRPEAAELPRESLLLSELLEEVVGQSLEDYVVPDF